MDDHRFKNAMDAVEPDESMIERLIKSEVYLFRRALTLICWGLALTSFNINIEGTDLALFSTWIGCVLLTLGLWMLRTEDNQMSGAYRLSVVTLILRALSYWLGAFPENGRVVSALIPLVFIVSLVIIFVTIHSLFAGLHNLALRFGNEALAKRLMNCFWLYVSLYAAVLLGMVIPFLIVAVIPYGLFVLVKLPLTVSKLKQYVPLGRRATTVKALNKLVWLTLGLYLIATVGGTFGCLYAVNAPKPDAVLYVNVPSAETAEIREKLISFGMPEYVLNDLPEDEVMLYYGIYNASFSIMNSSEITNRDGGKLEIVGFEGFLLEGRVRTLFYYRWLEPPKHAYVDLLSIASTQDTFAQFEGRNEKAMALYDREGKTYRQALLNEGAVAGYSASGSYSFGGTSGGLLTQIQLRLYPDAANQRGYAALTRVVTHPELPQNYNSFSTYVHQHSLWNRPHFSALNQTAGQGYSHIQNGRSRAKAFWSEGFYTMTNYEPEGWVWTEETKNWSWTEAP